MHHQWDNDTSYSMIDSQIKNSHDNIVAKSQINSHTSMVKHRKKKTKLIEQLN